MQSQAVEKVDRELLHHVIVNSIQTLNYLNKLVHSVGCAVVIGQEVLPSEVVGSR